MKMLLVDRNVRDNIGLRWFLQQYVAHDVDVELCTTLQQLSSKVQTFMPSVVILNVDLLPANTRDTAYYIIKQSGCDVIAITDEPIYQQALKAIALRAHALLHKPIDLEQLKNTLLTLPKPRPIAQQEAFYTSLFLEETVHTGAFFLVELEQPTRIRALYEWLHTAMLFQRIDVYALSSCIVCSSADDIQLQQLQAIRSYWQKEYVEAVNISVYDGEACTLREKYEAAKQALTERFYKGYGHIFYTSQQPQPASFDPLLSPQHQQEIMNSLAQFQLEPIRTLLAHLQYETFEQEDVRVHLTSVLAQVRRFMLQYDLQNEQQLEQQYRQLFRFIVEHPILYTIMREMLQFTQHVIEHAQREKRQLHSFKHDAGAYIARHFSDEALTLSDVAAALHLSRSYTSALFTKELGMPFVQYVQHVRLLEAEQLLAATSASIHAIATRCGFRDANYFSKLFKRKKGMTPTYYRKRMQR